MEEVKKRISLIKDNQFTTVTIEKDDQSKVRKDI
jgi:hypothetical protein